MQDKQPTADLWMEEQMFEEDLRAVLHMLRPNREQRLRGWSEYRTGGENFRATISWSGEFEQSEPERVLSIPRLADVLESLVVGATRGDAAGGREAELSAYRGVVRELSRRVEKAAREAEQAGREAAPALAACAG